MIFEKCLYGWMCVYVCIRLDLSFYSVDFNRRVLIFFVFFVWWRVKNPLSDWVDAFLFYFEFSIFSKFIFDFFLMIESRYLNRMGSKRIKIHIFSKKKFSVYHGSFVIKKTCFFFKLVTLKPNGQSFWEKSW